MNKITQRLLIFFVGLPAVVGIVVFLPHYNHLAINILTVIFSALGAVEFSVMLSQKNLSIQRKEAAVFGALPPASMILVIAFDWNVLLVPAVFTAVIAWLLLSRAFSQGDALDGFINRLAAGIAVLIYPGMLLAWIVGMTQWEKSASVILLTFLAAVFGSDSTAWASGMLFGKGNQGIIQASPKKSVAGFIGGAITPVLVGTGAVLLWPDLFILKPGLFSAFHPVFAGAVLGLLTGVAGTLGDLAESAIKRSSGLKDSGSIIMGRGGALDSVDSIALAAPVYYLTINLFFSLS
jgi:phosphatidate cytidylyltransferase